MSRHTKYLTGARSELIASAWLLGLGYQVFRNVCNGGPADLLAWNPNTDTRYVIDVKGRHSSSGVKLPAITKCRTPHNSEIHYLFIYDGRSIGFWRQRADGWPGTETYWPLDCPDPFEPGVPR